MQVSSEIELGLASHLPDREILPRERTLSLDAGRVVEHAPLACMKGKTRA